MTDLATLDIDIDRAKPSNEADILTGIVNLKSYRGHVLARFHLGMDSLIGEISLCDGLLDRGPSRYRSVRLHCGVESS